MPRESNHGCTLTSFLLRLALGIRPTVNASFNDLIFALKLVFKLVLELAHVRAWVVVNVHRVRVAIGTAASFQSAVSGIFVAKGALSRIGLF